MSDLETRIAQAKGDEPADIVLRGGAVFCVVTGGMIRGDVALCGDRIVGIGATYEGQRVIDVTGLTLVPVSSTHICMWKALVSRLLSLIAL